MINEYSLYPIFEKELKKKGFSFYKIEQKTLPDYFIFNDKEHFFAELKIVKKLINKTYSKLKFQNGQLKVFFELSKVNLYKLYVYSDEGELLYVRSNPK